MCGDAYHITQPAPEHEGGFRVMRNAVRDAGVTPDVVGYVNAHGTSTPIGDTLEAHAIRNFFGDHKVAVSSTKSMTGHLLGGAGGLEAGITVLALRDQILPPTINLENPDPDTAGMDLVPNHARKAEARIRHVELLRLRRHQRRAAVPPLDRISFRSFSQRHCARKLA